MNENTVTMDHENPIKKKCCGITITPNPPCLVAFAVFKIIANLITTGLVGIMMLAILLFGCMTVSLLLICMALILDIAFMITLIVGACKKSNYLLNLIYYYSVISLTAIVVITVGIIVLTYISDYHFISRKFYRNLSERENILIHFCILSAYTCKYFIKNLLRLFSQRDEAY